MSGRRLRIRCRELWPTSPLCAGREHEDQRLREGAGVSGIGLLRERHRLPALGSEADVALHELPNHDALTVEQLRTSREFLPNQRGRSAIVDDRRIPAAAIAVRDGL